MYLTFIDFERAFDSIDHQVLWNNFKHYGIPEKIIFIITCQSFRVDFFPVSTGVRYKDVFSLDPPLSLMVIYWVSKMSYNVPLGIQWTLHFMS